MEIGAPSLQILSLPRSSLAKKSREESRKYLWSDMKHGIGVCADATPFYINLGGLQEMFMFTLLVEN